MKMAQFTIHTSNKNGFATWNSPCVFNRRVENFDVEDLKINLYVGQRLNDHVDYKDIDEWETKYVQAPTDGTYESFLQWCKDNDYIDDYVVERYTV